MGRRILNTALTVFLISSVLFILTVSVYGDIGDTTLKKGMNHPDVAKLQEKLSILGYFEEDEYTNYFGDKTEAALKKFQKDSGLKQDGVAGKQTFSILTAKIKQKELIPENFTPIREGNKGETVTDIQNKLKTLGMYTGEANGSFDAATKESVIKFQASSGITATGIVDSATMIKLKTAVSSKIADRASASRRIINAKVVDYAKKFLGAPYRWGAATGKAFDCSGFVMYVLDKFNVKLDHTASGQFKTGEKIAKDELQPGDLVFFTTYKKGPSHVGIYIGDNQFIHASSGVDRVTVTDLDTSYYRARYLGARRYNLSDSK
ncbi:MAG: peptidoglycan-binding protein [Caulobacteraceae bacterium]